MPDKYTLDASVAAKWFNNESLTDKAVRLRDAFMEGKIELAAPEQIVYEVGNSIWKNSALTHADAAAAIRDLLDVELELVRLTPELATSAMKLARSSSITFYDAAYIVVADHLNAPLISADSLMISKSKESIHLRDFSS
jgi:predicted nucleic acid-binding protein